MRLKFFVDVVFSNGSVNRTSAFWQFGGADKWARGFLTGGMLGSKAFIVDSNGRTLARYIANENRLPVAYENKEGSI